MNITPKNKVLYDIVHGYIEIDKNTEMIINHPLFQRLKDIKQQASYHLFPSANHTRFEHSLGVMKLAVDAFYHYANELEEAIIDSGRFREYVNFREYLMSCMINQSKSELDFDFNINTKPYREIYKHWLKFHLQYAALLHDIGHAPLSHIGEHFYNKEEIKKEIEKIIKDENEPLKEYNKLNDETDIEIDNLKNGSSHEWMSCYIILKKFRSPLKQIYENIISEDANEFKLNIKSPLKVDFGFIIRIITGNKYEDTNDIGNGIIQLVNSETIDCDRLDYALRDNFMVGGIGAFVDTKRLFNNITFNRDTFTIKFKKGAISSLKNYIDCRDNLYMWVCNHHLVVYTDFLYKKSLEKLFEIYPEYENNYFTCEKITTNMPTDNEIHYLLRKNYNDLLEKEQKKELSDDDKNKEKYLLNLLKQLYQRDKKLTSLYKTRKDYMILLENADNIHQEKSKDINKYLRDITEKKQDEKDEKERIKKYEKFVSAIEANLKCDNITFDKGDFLVLSKANKDFTEDNIKLISIDDQSDKYTSLKEYISPRTLDNITDITIFIYYRPINNVDNYKMKEKITKAIADYVHNYKIKVQ